ncbi:MAG: M14 family metallopeptidase [Cyclobacteriaceae bacterium]|nr:M14 family metallopeptidase [Cyclobacteriaceae bacterium]
MNKHSLLILFLVWSLVGQAQQDFNYFYNQEVQFDDKIPTPEEILGFEVGEWHVSHDKLVEYMKALALASDRVSLEVAGYSYEHRPILLLTITNPENHSNIENIRREHLAVKTSKDDIANKPVVVWLGHSIHGNEASGSNASLLVAYYLAAAQGEDIEKMLANSIILLDPSYNPDGLNRFASWVNSHKSKNLDSNSLSLEHNEAWPRARTNHYWFDLNRDWLPVQHPESQARVKNFYKWQPNILTDQHEMGSNSTYFFQPGIPSRNNPLTPEKAFDLTRKIAKYHAKAMDAMGSQYYSEESFDDYYPGKGSTFPDLNGSVGILFEQGSSRGHLRGTQNGDLSFKFAIRNHVTTSLSTLEAAQELRGELLAYQNEFFSKAIGLASNDAIKGYLFTSNGDMNKSNAFLDVLIQHRIAPEKLTSNYKQFSKEESYLVKLSNEQYRLTKAIFEKRISFKDSLFYDVSAWTLPLAFGLEYQEITAKELAKLRTEPLKITERSITNDLKNSNYGYLLKWNDYMAPAALSQLQTAGLRTKLTTHAFQLNGVDYVKGSIFIPVQNQSLSKKEIFELMKDVESRYFVPVEGINSGDANGVKLGSPSFKNLNSAKIAVIGGNGVSSYEVGEVWHLLDQRMDMPMSLVAIDQLNSTNLSQFNTIIMVNGNYSKLKVEHLHNWVKSGGLIIATKSAGKWLSKNKISTVKYMKAKPDSTQQRPYELMSRYRGAQVIGGAIFETKADLSNPLFYGYSSTSIPVFRNSTLMMERSKNAYANPLMYTKSPLLSGYISSKNIKKLANTSAVQIDKVGAGTVITFTDNPNFRAFWYGTNRMFLNAIFFGREIRTK